MGTCETCLHWEVFPANTWAGRCKILGAILWPKSDIESLIVPASEESSLKLNAEISLTEDRFGHNPVSEVIAVRTVKDFGCVYHYQHSTN